VLFQRFTNVLSPSVGPNYICGLSFISSARLKFKADADSSVVPYTLINLPHKKVSRWLPRMRTATIYKSIESFRPSINFPVGPRRTELSFCCKFQNSSHPLTTKAGTHVSLFLSYILSMTQLRDKCHGIIATQQAMTNKYMQMRERSYCLYLPYFSAAVLILR